MKESAGRFILAGRAEGPVLAMDEPLSFWGGVDPAASRIIDVHHPKQGASLDGVILVMPTTRGSCTGSGVLLDMALGGRAPAALVFSEVEDVITLGALVAGAMFDRPIPVIRLNAAAHARLSQAASARIMPEGIEVCGDLLPLDPPDAAEPALTADDRALLAGEGGEAASQAMRILVAMAAAQGAEELVDVSRVHIDGCIYASPANLTFAARMRDLGAKVRVPSTMNAISVDRQNWQKQGVPPVFGSPAAKLADAYVAMGCRPTFTCAPYLLEDVPQEGEEIGWSESNAVIYANSVLGARSPKHPDFLDLCIALTGRAPLAGVYLDAPRAPTRVLEVMRPEGADDLFWPLMGWLAGKAAPDCIPILNGLSDAAPHEDDLKALCAAFGTTSAAPMLHVEGITPEAPMGRAEAARAAGAEVIRIGPEDFRKAWAELNHGPEAVELIAIGSPHASLRECRLFADALEAAGKPAEGMTMIVTAGRTTIAAAEAEGLLARLHGQGVQVIPDLCWCSISEPVFPPQTRAVLTNSGKYAHYGPGLSGRKVRISSMADCARAAVAGGLAVEPPLWLA